MELPLPHDWFYLGLRLGFVGLIYLFLWQVARIILRDMMQIAQRPEKARAARARLLLVDPANSALQPGTAFRIAPGSTVGRSPECTIVLDDPSVSGIHAKFESRSHAWYLSDLSSTNGTFVNSRRVTGATYIEADDIVQFGRMTFQLDA